MNAAASGDDTHEVEDLKAQRERLFEEVNALRAQRNDLQARLAACTGELTALDDVLAHLRETLAESLARIRELEGPDE